ncbi:MAG: DUF308 domain-containing protein [Candidatus Bathyarchaeia archaeon]
MTETRSSSGYRALEIILGIIALVAGFLALFYPAAVIVTLVVFFGIIIFIIGIFRLATAGSSSWLPGGSRGTNAAIGIILIIIGLLILFFPLLATATIAILLGIGLLIYGIGRIIVGVGAHNMNGGVRGLLIVLGILIAIFGFIVIFFPVLGVWTYAFFVSIAFILIGIDALAAGAAGTRML